MKKKKTISEKRAESFLASQLFALTVLEQVSRSGLDESTREHCFNAMAIAAEACDKTVSEHPQLAKRVESITSSFNRAAKAVSNV